MKGIFIAYDQAYNMEIADVLENLGCRGFTMWQDIAGRGGYTGRGEGRRRLELHSRADHGAADVPGGVPAGAGRAAGLSVLPASFSMAARAK